ncbi:cyclic di-AMP synthase CdaS [Paenibacillus sp. J23TS9]|uniref:diadenylate cyclase n=1 Tax=Paenibacillus sp. J23TS9 TaxID=2807193 RepID=UPI001B2F3610|nr:diadenylate cyclase [Paenibacillus sp. J23TS9]GIP25975.1 cyclic di-AMP synthase CdaS [Paenibacillus sp. J23TS9]
MDRNYCTGDYPLLRNDLTDKLTHIATILDHDIATLEQNDIQILNDIEEITKGLSELESITSTYFLNCLLTEYTNYSKEISRSIHKMSLKGQTALIVLEKNDPVAPLIKDGTPINAKISSQLIESIFHPESQLSHGAVLIQSDMVVSASNVLPVSSQIFWDRFFDIRELSALGLSELCDALILLISKDKSTLFCLNGNLFPFSTSSP